MQKKNALDYFSFGMPMPNRNVEGDYRYGYQGEFAEKEKELGDGVNSFEERIWDARAARWLTPDPAKKGDTPYIGMYNNPLKYVDVKGRDTLVFHLTTRKSMKGNFDVHLLTFSVEANGKRRALDDRYAMVANHLSQQKPGNQLEGGGLIHPKTGKEILDIAYKKMGSHNFANTIFLKGGGKGKFIHPGNWASDFDGCWGVACDPGNIIVNSEGDGYIDEITVGALKKIRDLYDKIKRNYNLNGQHIILELNSKALHLPVKVISQPRIIISPRNF